MDMHWLPFAVLIAGTLFLKWELYQLKKEIEGGIQDIRDDRAKRRLAK